MLSKLADACRYTIIIGLCLGLFLYGIIGRLAPASELLSLPLGSVDPRAFIYSWGGNGGVTQTVIFNVFMANLPQLVLSAVYFTYNSLFTCFFLGSEWSSYSTGSKSLRVSNDPQGNQRSTHFLQLPYRFALPLIVLSGVLHWLCSQSIFLVSVLLDDTAIFPEDGDPLFLDEWARCGYSPRAILTVVLLGALMVCIVVGTGRRRFPTGMPVAGSCSAAMSALCHVPNSEDGEEASKMSVQWGVITAEDKQEPEGLKHCSFSSREVGIPQPGVLYAGLHC
jgi:hypothetical protein